MSRFYTALRHLALFLLATVMAVLGFYAAWMLAILYFKVSGRLLDGPMFHDGMTTPEYADVFIGLAASAAVITACLLLRRFINRRL